MPVNVRSKILLAQEEAVGEGRTTYSVPVVGDDYIMGEHPQYMVVDRGDVVPDGYYLPNIDFVYQYQDLMA